MKYDVIENIGNSKIQHGKYNDRIYLMKVSINDFPEIINKMKDLAIKNRYSKIFAKVPANIIKLFKNKGFEKEAKIPNFYNGRIDTYFMSQYLDKNRKYLKNEINEKMRLNLELAFSKKGNKHSVKKNPNFTIRPLDQNDIDKLSNIYKKVFTSYPFPIFNKNYLESTMMANVKYYGVFNNKKLIAASSAEIDPLSENAEMTDFATDHDYSGNNLSILLLRKMEEDLSIENIKTLYTIARALSPAMNITFAKQNYNYSGTLINNTNIAGKIESMNVWFKPLN